MIKGIQILRAIAAITVVFFHYQFLNIKTGDFGVDIFFIISGFIIAYVVNKTTVDFFKKRLIRVVPLYYLATLLTILVAFVFPQGLKHVIINTEAIVKSISFIPYKLNTSGPILSLGWTLNNEMLFYIVMFICILLFKKKSYLVPACAAILIIFLLCLYIINPTYYPLNFYKSGLLPEFIFGLGLYHFNEFYQKRQSVLINNLLIALGFISICFVIVSDLFLDITYLSRNITKGIPLLFFVNTFLLLEDKFNKESRIIKIALKLGEASYVMYLFHPFIIFFLERVVYPKLFGHPNGFLEQFAMMLGAMAFVCIISIGLFEFLDKPIMGFFKKYQKIDVLKGVKSKESS